MDRRALAMWVVLAAALVACTSEVVTTLPGSGEPSDDGGGGEDVQGDSGGEDGGADAGADGAEDAPSDAPDPAEDVAADADGEEIGPTDAAEDPLEDAPPEEDAPTADAETGGDDDADPWSGTPCAVSGRPGVCLHTALCDGGRVPTPGFCPGPAEIQCCAPPGDPDPDPPGTCDEEAHPTPNAGIEEESLDPGCPPGMIRVAAFCVDRWEAFIVEIDANGQEQPWSPFFNPGDRRIAARSAEGAVPQGYITGLQAQRACQEAGKRLCTDIEWLRACQGPQGLTYPYGNTLQAGVCNDARAQHPVVEYFGTSADWIWSELDNPCISQQHDTLALTGERAGCVTAEGAFDMMGNLHEWTADPNGTFRGGFYVDTYRNGPGCLYRTTAHNTQHWDYSTGFRCCADPR